MGVKGGKRLLVYPRREPLSVWPSQNLEETTTRKGGGGGGSLAFGESTTSSKYGPWKPNIPWSLGGAIPPPVRSITYLPPALTIRPID